MPILSVVVPTISRREESLARTIAAYEETLFRKSHELIVIKDESSWPRACNIGYAKAKGKIVHFGADDLEPLANWWKEPLFWLKHQDELPAARVMEPLDNGNLRFLNREDGDDLDLTHFTRVPIMRRDQWERIGLWPELIYYADMWLSEYARTLGIRTRVIYSYAFIHHWSQIGRVDSAANLEEAAVMFKRLREEMDMAGQRKKPVVVERIEIYQDAEGDYRWRALAANNEIVSNSRDRYNNRMYAKKMAHEIHPAARIEFSG